jgi:endonuclease III
LVEILDEGSYTRYDYKTADKLLAVAGNLTKKYSGSVERVHDAASDVRDLEKRLKDLGKGIGNVTVSIFLRDLRGVWEKADPFPTDLEILASVRLGIVSAGVSAESALKQMKAFWAENNVPRKSFANFETALLRLGRDYCRKSGCADCFISSGCPSREAPSHRL